MMLAMSIIGAWLGLGFVVAVLLGRGIAAGSEPSREAPAESARAPAASSGSVAVRRAA